MPDYLAMLANVAKHAKANKPDDAQDVLFTVAQSVVDQLDLPPGLSINLDDPEHVEIKQQLRGVDGVVVLKLSATEQWLTAKMRW